MGSLRQLLSSYEPRGLTSVSGSWCWLVVRTLDFTPSEIHDRDSADKKQRDVYKLRGITAKNVPNLVKIPRFELNKPQKIKRKKTITTHNQAAKNQR